MVIGEKNIYLFTVINMENNILQSEWKTGGRFIFANNDIIRLALGESDDEEIEEDLHELSIRLNGECGLLFTHRNKNDVLEWSKPDSALEYARSCFIATETVVLPEGLPMTTFILEIKCSWSKNGGYKSYFNEEVSIDNAGDEEDNDDNDEDYIAMCVMFLQVTKNLVETKAVSPSKIPKLFHYFGKRAVDQLYPSEPEFSTTILNKTCLGVDKPGDNINIIENKQKKPISKNGCIKIKDWIMDLLENGTGDVIVWINKPEGIFRFVDPEKAAELWGATKPFKRTKWIIKKWPEQ